MGRKQRGWITTRVTPGWRGPCPVCIQANKWHLCCIPKRFFPGNVFAILVRTLLLLFPDQLIVLKIGRKERNEMTESRIQINRVLVKFYLRFKLEEKMIVYLHSSFTILPLGLFLKIQIVTWYDFPPAWGASWNI